MIFHQSLSTAVALLLLASNSVNVSAFDAKDCDVYVFRTQENALWHCGNQLPAESNGWQHLYCDHSLGEANTWPFAWASEHPDDWCDFMTSTVRTSNEDHYALTPDIGINETPGPNVNRFSTIVDWGCYMVDEVNGVMTTTEAYIVESRKGKHASTTTEQCELNHSYFDYWTLHPHIRNIQWAGHVPDPNYVPEKNAWGRCHYDDSVVRPNYVPSLGVQYAECLPGYKCELKYQDYAACMPDPGADHECCISWNNKCENRGDCCAGSECNIDGYCQMGLEQEFADPPGICPERTIKVDKKVWTRCFEYESGGQGDCAAGYLCSGNWWYASCVIDPAVKTDCCKWNYDNTNPRPGDCCVGWKSHCHETDEIDGTCKHSQCVPGRETGVTEQGTSMLDVHDRICNPNDAPPLASYNEELGKCVGAVCGVWGDPHIITCDDLHYDCQAVGLFTVMKNHMFNIQGNFVFIEPPWGGASITADLAIDYLKDSPNDVPTMQFSFPDFTKVDENNQVYDDRSRTIGPCPVMFYLDGEMIDISQVEQNGYLYGDANSDHSVKLTDWNQIDINHKVGVDANGDNVYSSSVVWIEGGGPFSEWSCIISYFICLPGDEEELFRQTSVGLLGTPTGTTKDDWMAPDGQTLLLPDTDRNEASFNYCLENWCVDQEQSILTYEDGLTYDDYKCGEQEYIPFDVNSCANTDEIVLACAGSENEIACQIEKCVGNPDPEIQIEVIGNITTNSADPNDNFLEFPNVNETDDVYGDCANLGAGLSASTGVGAFSSIFPSLDSIWGSNSFSIGYDKSVSLLVGGNFHCKAGPGFEGRGVFVGDMTLEQGGCERLAATAHGSLIHPFENTACVEVGGDVSIDATFKNKKYIMNEDGNTAKSCHFVYRDGCQVNGAACPTNMTVLEEQHIYTNGDFVKKTDMDLSRWEEELVLLKQKTNYWKSLDANGVAEVLDGVLIFGPGPDNNPVQIFNIEPIATTISNVVFKKEMLGKTIMIVVEGDGDFAVPPMCFHPTDAIATDAPICGVDTFPPSLTASIVWVFPTRGKVHMVGSNELMGSVVMPNGDLTFSTLGHSGRMIVGGDLTVDGKFSELHNYEFDPASHPLPLGDDLSQICEVVPPPACNETYKTLTSETACPSKPDGVVKLIKSSAEYPEDEPILYDIIIEPPTDINSAHTIKFKVDNPFTNHTDIYIKHVKKVGKYGMDPTCESMPFTAGCQREAPEIEVGCHEYEGVEPFALVNIYFASNTDSFVMDIASGDVEIDKCCKPPEEYAEGYGIIEYTFEIQCTCPETVTEA